MVEAMMPGEGAVMNASANVLSSPAMRWKRAMTRAKAQGW
jgi:hypothetical protein